MHTKTQYINYQLRGIRNQFTINREDVIGTLLSMLGFAVVAIIGCSIFYKVVLNHAHIFDVMYGILIGIACLFTIIITAIFFAIQFPLGITFSGTRGDVMIRLGGMCMILHSCSLILAWICYQLVVFFYSRFDHAIVATFQWIPLWGWLLITFAPILAGTFTGAIIAKFGKRGGLTLYTIFIILCFTPSVIITSEILDSFVGFNFVWTDGKLMALALTIILAFSCINVILLKKVSIR